MSRHQPFYEYMCAVQAALTQSCQRRIVVLRGASTSCFSVMDRLCEKLVMKSALFVSGYQSTLQDEADPCHLLSITKLPADKLKQRLGQEVDTLIWDGFSGLNPDALGIASGLLKGGGIFFLLLPDFELLIQQGDRDYLRMCADDSLLQQCHTFFLQRLVRHLLNDPCVLVYPVDQPEIFRPIALDLPVVGAPQLPTGDQMRALNAIIKAARGHRYRPLLLLADRGRGKSSVLGMAAAQLYIQHNYHVAISAPDKTTCQTAFVHYQRIIGSTISDPVAVQAALEAFQFIPLDQMADKSSDFHMIMIDEAAAMPTPLLQILLSSHPRIVFATTQHGYEGHGQGFAIRFRQTLDKFTPQWKALSLNSAVRWQDHDALEQWFFRFLFLKTSSARGLSLKMPPTASSNKTQHRTGIEIIWLEQAELHHDEVLFESVFSLLVSAHYQTKPSDIRLILDHPQVKLAIAVGPVTHKHLMGADEKPLLGVMLILEEGGLASDMAPDIIAGTRRPRGHLFPQALCASSGHTECLNQRSYRITRIAVTLDARERGIGSALLTAAGELAKANNIDSLSSSFGLRPELVSFWSKNHFDLVKLGLHADGASGTQSIMVMRPLSDPAIALSYSLRKQFQSYFLFNLNRLYQWLDCENCLAILHILAARTAPEDFPKRNITATLKAFAYAQRSFDDTNQEIFNYVLASLNSQNWHQLDQRSVNLLAMKVLQGHSNAHCCKYLKRQGKKDIEQSLRKALQILMAI